MNGGLSTYTNNNTTTTSDVNVLESTNGLKAQAISPGVEANTHTNGGVLHIPAKRPLGGHWQTASTTSASASSYSIIDSNGSSVDPMAVSAASPYATSHYSSLAASAEAARRSSPSGMETKPSLNFWGSDYHKYSAAAAASTAASTQSSSASPTTAASMASMVAASECSQMSAAAGFAAHQAAAWNYPHPGQYAAALASPEQAAAEAARARQMAADSAAGFHADYTRLQYAPEGIYTHPPGMKLT